MSRVLVLLTNYKRPANLPLCIKAWREQSLAPASVVVVDNSPFTVRGVVAEIGNPHTEFYPRDEMSGYYPDKYDGPDDVWRIKTNLGPLCRLWPALALAPRYEYVLFADDDFLPGREGLLTAVQAAKSVNDKFATIGQEGRTFDVSPPPVNSADWTKPLAWSYRFGNTPRNADIPTIVDCTVRCHLVLAATLPRILRLREKLPAQLCEDHDDLLLCLSLQTDPGFPSYVMTASTLERQLIKENLPGCNGPEACWKRPDHLVQRSRFINLAYQAGWRSGWDQGSNH